MKVAVVGLGIAGLSVCTRLSAAGHSVHGYERFDVGTARGSSRGDARIFRLVPGEGAVYVELANRALTEWRKLELRMGRRLIDSTAGLMAGPEGSQFVRSCLRLAQEYGREYSVMDAREVSNHSRGWHQFPSDWLICRLEDCGVIRAREAVAAMARAASQNGAQLFSKAAIRGIAAGARLNINGEYFEFDRIIVTAGPWISQLLPDMSEHLTVVRKSVGYFRTKLGIAQPPDLCLLCLDDKRGFYGLPTPSGLYKGGVDRVGAARVDPDAESTVSKEEIDEIARSIRNYLPMHDPSFTLSDSCFYTMTADWNFLISRVSGNPQVLCMSCCSGHGFKHAPALGDIALDWLEGRQNYFLERFDIGPERATPVIQAGDPV